MPIWGDSNVMQLAQGIAVSTKAGVIRATKSNCGPIIGFSFFQPEDFYNRNWAYACLRFGHSVLNYLDSSSSVDVVVLSSRFDQYLGANHVLIEPGDLSTGNAVEQKGGEEILLAGIRKTVASIRACGMRGDSGSRARLRI
jgi:hypothetical protein